ncbi:nuclease-related domain-containing DEAD/DEAH box helicase [Arthrobacter subterraneus]|uniref:nuclease-related domain-containing DEAD/DEAH box helicase n=1 Tax=Arthrobacter subterraneus TaxID=335973 RepID=UPI0038093B95
MAEQSVRCIPEQPIFDEGHSAERAVWQLLKSALPNDVVLAHSVQVRHGSAEHEIDLLVLWPHVGLAAIEVKGGQLSIDRGQWYQSDRSGKRVIKSPLVQSQGAQHAFREWIGEQLGTPLTSRFAYMACLPYTSVPANWTLSGAPRALILDREDLTDAAEKIRRAIETEAGGATQLAPSYLERMVRKLEGTLDALPSDTADSAQSEDLQDQLTARQDTLLSATRDIPRIRFTGGAGSGKTWLALAKAQRLCKEGKRVGLFCYNKGLGMYLDNQAGGWRQMKPAFTGEFHEYVRSVGVPDGEGQAYFDEEMPRLLKEKAARLTPDRKFDAVVVDEAQDFAPLWWEALLQCLKDPESSEIYAFMDDRQDVYHRSGGTADFTHGPLADLVPIHVDENLRNTRRIAQTFKPLAGRHFTPRGNTGMPVRLVDCSTDQALDRASDCVDALIEEGWAANQIALLTTNHRHPIHQQHHLDGTTRQYWDEFHAKEAEFYGHVLGFKGLERSVVILCVDGFKELERAAEQLYVGMSRARSLLVIVGSPDLIAQGGGRELAQALRGCAVWDPTPAE